MTNQEILAKVASGEISAKEAEALLSKPSKDLSFKVSDKGACSVYGLQRFPITLYVEQWERLLDAADEIRAFLKDNDRKLTRKAS